MAALWQLVTRRRLMAVLVVLVLLATGAVLWASQGFSSTPAPRLGTVATGTVRQTVPATGTIAAAQEADLSFGVSGQVTSVPVTVGQQVAAGQALATISSASLPSQVAQAQASVASNQAKLAADTGASAAQRNADAAAITAAQAQLAAAQQALAGATLASPIAGTVAAVNVTVGQQVSTGSSGGAAAAASGSGGGSSGAGSTGGGSATSVAAASSASGAQIVVLSTNSYVVDAAVDDTQIGLLEPGLQAVIVPNGSTAQVYGTVSTVGMVATQTSGVASYPVTIAVTGTPAGLHDGASAQVSIIVKQLTDVLVVPSAAVHQQNGAAVVEEMRDGKPVPVPVTVGLSSGGQTQITGGVTAGTQIVLPVATAGSGSGSTSGRGGVLGGGGFGGGGFGGGGAGRGTGGRTGAGGAG